ncbi:MAG: gluconolactonase [Saprospiraceae bacterium]|jgi:gluconolactonase
MNNVVVLTLIAVLMLSCVENRSSKVHTSSVFTSGIEGPATDNHGDLYVVNYKWQGTIGVIPVGEVEPEIFIVLPETSVGNGIRFLNDSIFFVADYVNHNIFRVNKHSKEIIVHASDSLMNQPNDIAITDDGVLYASDPNWSDETGQLWLIKSNGETVLLENEMGTTNGVEVSPDGKNLYVNESVQGNVWKYDISPDGSVKNKILFHHFNEFGMDGMRCKKDGELYIARYGKGTIAVLSIHGELLHEIVLQGPKPTNVTFSPAEDLLYITMQQRQWVEVIELK